MAQISTYFYQDFTEFDATALKKHLRPVAQQPLEVVKEKLSALSQWTAEAIHEQINATAEQLELGMGKVGMPLRVAATGAGNSPSLDITLALLPKEKVIARIDMALAAIAERIANS